MENIKKLIIASVLSMMTASCYAGSIVVGSEQQSSVDIAFAAPQQVSVDFAPVPGLKAGWIQSNTDIATIAVSSAAAKQFAIAADFSAKDIRNGDTWILTGKNTGKGITVYFYGETSKPQATVNYRGHPWFVYNINDKLGVKLAGEQNIVADVYPMAINIAAYQA
ncbi:hypothetical protein G3C57_004419 [Salmonella enterica]|uniref:hypothetical protein n=1 Tax=Salmonella enterica TaxID=28901 RepID=UPI0009AEB2F5|nr:hypothetical protein [Salmonella enterica]EBG4967983.1 hypothetical protein [Salmonella enterica subsp. enterica serovar Agoueve]EDT2775839.1 hypothetical protein [Salmonella enterica subsp. enterica]HAU7011709.1 hypothetical protein [Salmonella enterica subsp. enterica serovar Berta]EAM1087597.1 hypothetical protein [Salmonella enterica]EAM7546292.1 hypothetical protein [Salmonella enterica]